MGAGFHGQGCDESSATADMSLRPHLYLTVEGGATRGVEPVGHSHLQASVCRLTVFLMCNMQGYHV